VLELPVTDAIAVEHNPLGRPPVSIVKGLQEVSAEKDEEQVGTLPNLPSGAFGLIGDGVEQVRQLLFLIHHILNCYSSISISYLLHSLSTGQGSSHERHSACFCADQEPLGT
jgi:hypothetical protein